jgi:hypothetical protein
MFDNGSLKGMAGVIYLEAWGSTQTFVPQQTFFLCHGLFINCEAKENFFSISIGNIEQGCGKDAC